MNFLRNVFMLSSVWLAYNLSLMVTSMKSLICIGCWAMLPWQLPLMVSFMQKGPRCVWVIIQKTIVESIVKLYIPGTLSWDRFDRVVLCPHLRWWPWCRSEYIPRLWCCSCLDSTSLLIWNSKPRYEENNEGIGLETIQTLCLAEIVALYYSLKCLSKEYTS